ncbi:MAG: hypothetical protein JWM72_4722 [Actinomycetia bacterium]|nr:hypothetical protein [Actinomycetes bacterium]
MAPMGKLSNLWRWMWAPTKSDEEQWSAGAYHCPRCGQELPAFRPGNGNRGIWSTRSDGELIRECPFDGRPPFNDKAKAMLASGKALGHAQHGNAITADRGARRRAPDRAFCAA